MSPYVRPIVLKQRPSQWQSGRSLILPAVVLVMVFIGAIADWATPIATARMMIDRAKPAPKADQYFSGCDDARAAGRENIPTSDPSYRDHMDGDGDGLACEPRDPFSVWWQ